MKWFTQRIVLAVALIALSFTAQGQQFPAGPINLVIPLAPGDAADIAARAMGEEISRLLKTPVVAINRPGAGGAVGTSNVVQARKDGHTILFAQNSALTFRAVLDPRSVTYDPVRDLLPLGILQSYAAPEQMAAEIRDEFKQVSEMAKKNGLVK